MKSIFKYNLFLIICCFLTLFAVGLFPTEINAETPAEELVLINIKLEELDKELNMFHKCRYYYESLINAEFLIYAPNKESGSYIAVTGTEMHEYASAVVFGGSIKNNDDFASLYQQYLDLVIDITSKTDQIKKEVYEMLSGAKQIIEKKQNEVFQLREKKEAILSGQLEPIPLTLNECETETVGICGTWTLKDGAYHALWSNGAEAVINIVRFDDENVIFNRHDKEGISKGLRADYVGKRVSDFKAEGTVKWTWNNNEWTGTWDATW
jgi:hypothetical protein